jgi:hypothetical protein
MTLRNRKKFSDEQLRQARKELAHERAENQRDEARAAARAFVLEEQRAKRQQEYSHNIQRAVKRFRIPMAIALTLLILIPGWRTARVNACLNEQMAYARIEYTKFPLWVVAPSTLERVQELVPSVPVAVLQESSTQGGYAISQMYRAAAEAASSAQSRQYWNTVVEVIRFYEWLERRSFQGTALQEFARECEQASWFGQPVLPSYVGPKVSVPWPVPVFE